MLELEVAPRVRMARLLLVLLAALRIFAVLELTELGDVFQLRKDAVHSC